MKSKLLIVDDSATILKIVAMAFEKESVIVQGVSNGKEAFEKMSDFKPNIVVTDIDMPGMTGFQLSKKIKESDQFKSVPVLLLTSDFEGFDQKLFKDCKADAHISKPFKSEGIVNKVKELLEQTSTDKPSSIKLSVDDVVKEPASIKLSMDDVVENSESVKTSSENVFADTGDNIDSLISDDLGDIADDVSEEILHSDTRPVKSKKSEPVAKKTKSKENKNTGEPKANTAPEKSPDEMSLEQILESAEESLLADESEEIADDSEELKEGDDFSEVGEVQEELEILTDLDKVEETANPISKENEPITSEPFPGVAVSDEKGEPKKVSPGPISNDSHNEEKIGATGLSSKTGKEMSIEDLLSSAEELLKDNYLEKTQAITAEKENPPEKNIFAQDKESDFTEISQKPKAIDLDGQQVITKNEDQSFEGYIADVDSSSLELEDELDSAFHAIQNFNKAPEGRGQLHGTEERANAPKASQIFVEPESEDLLNQMASSAFASGGIEGKPDLIQETLSYLSDLSPASESEEKPSSGQSQIEQGRKDSMNKGTTADMFSEVIGEHIQRILERSLQDAIAKEISGLSRTIEQSVQEIVKEVTPGIARTIIQEEIEKIRKMEEV